MFIDDKPIRKILESGLIQICGLDALGPLPTREDPNKFTLVIVIALVPK